MEEEDDSDDAVLAWACKHSSLFRGLFTLLDVEIRLAVEPFILWKQGDFRHFLNALPAMCAIIASGHKPKVAKVVLMSLERMALYLEHHPDALEHIAANCTLFDEELIEFLTAKIGRLIRARGKLEMSTYEKTVGSMKGTDAVIRMLDEFAFKRKKQGGEHQRLRGAYLSNSWDFTNVKLAEFVREIFTNAL